MKHIGYGILGMIFGSVLYKSEVISWFRIQEMFRFESFHMYGIIGSAIIVGMLSVMVLKRFRVTAFNGEPIEIPKKRFNHGYWIGGILFGMGWALTGACPGPMFTHLGAGTSVITIAILSALIGTWVYSYLRPNLLH
ncbi:MAG TPA: YeeE/YedE family protein [candidate division Zixibacteria bacterium]|nr:YeeE/YedE family protein [candidate division Zixibacteria bacterium]